jgi:hypothetical protein
VGTSRTRAAVRPEVFDTLMTRVTGQPSLSINLGMGWCTMAEHYFGLRKLLETKPDILRGVVVFIEAPSGLPEYTTWKSNWIVTDRTDLLTPYIHRSDLISLWKNATTDVGMKFMITANLVAPFMEHIPRVRQNALLWMDSTSRALYTPLLALAKMKPMEDGPESDLTSEGGIRVDAKGVETARDLAIRLAKEDLRNQPPWNAYDSTIVAEVVRMIKQAGGYAVFSYMPLSQVQQEPYDTDLRKRERAAFQSTLKAWNCVMLQPTMALQPEDFPDLWHLRKSLAPEFTAALANAFIAMARQASPSGDAPDSDH